MHVAVCRAAQLQGAFSDGLAPHERQGSFGFVANLDSCVLVVVGNHQHFLQLISLSIRHQQEIYSIPRMELSHQSQILSATKPSSGGRQPSSSCCKYEQLTSLKFSRALTMDKLQSISLFLPRRTRLFMSASYIQSVIINNRALCCQQGRMQTKTAFSIPASL